ncbi:MAG: DUF4175 family protein [Thermomicrobiales bacterium]
MRGLARLVVPVCLAVFPAVAQTGMPGPAVPPRADPPGAAVPPLAMPPLAAPPPAPPAIEARPLRAADTRTQAALRRVLGVLMQQYGDLTGTVPEPLNDADIAMREAGRALDAGDDQSAAAAIQRAIEALQKGGRSMSQQLAQQFGQGGEEGDEGEDGMGGDEAGDRNGPGRQRGRGWGWEGRGDANRQASRRGDDRDPLGRKLREDGQGRNAEESGVKVPDDMEQARAHAIQEELRRRGGEKTRPQPELEYIDRLLKQF